MDKLKRIVIVGATSAIAEHCARIWTHREAIDLTLVGRDRVRIERVAKDLKARSPKTQIRIMQMDFLDSSEIKKTVDCIMMYGDVDIVMIAHGSLPNQTFCQENLEACRDSLEINAISPILFAESFIKNMEVINQGTMVIIGSVAGDRGRKSNYVYGSAKGMIAIYVQGLQHRLASTNVKVVLIKPGPTDTPMTSHLKDKGLKMASVESVAERIVTRVSRGHTEVYVPIKWKFIMMIIKNLPKLIFNKLNI